MSIKKDLENALKDAMKSRDILILNAIRLALTSIKLSEIENGKELEDHQIYSILQKEIKTKEETISEAEKVDRKDMIAQLKKEINILKQFLPKELTDDELIDLIKKIILDSNAKSLKDMRNVMKLAIQSVGGRASNERINKIVKEFLSNHEI